MQTKKIIAVLAVMLMAAMPFACIAGECSQISIADGSENTETGVHLSLHDLDNDDIKLLGWDQWIVSMFNGSNDLLTNLMFATYMPGINPDAFFIEDETDFYTA